MTLMGVHRFFPPIFTPGARILLLGTFPSPLSREKGEYYGNPRNQFWPIIFGVFGLNYDAPDYETKKAALTSNGIALWDVIESCEVDGALDSSIRNPVYNAAIPEFIAVNGIREVYCNGGNAYTFYRRGIGGLPRNVLPSTSPANASMRREDKQLLWARALLGLTHQRNFL